MENHIFISYRREDSRGAAGRIYDRLERYFGHDRIFMDVDTIQPGMDFVDAIEKAVGKSDIFLVIIGSNWATSTDKAGQKRLDNPEDFVRLEVGSALKRNVWLIPVLVDGAMMPRSNELPDDLKSITRRNAIEISHTRFNMDADRLIRAIEQAFQQLGKHREDNENLAEIREMEYPSQPPEGQNDDVVPELVEPYQTPIQPTNGSVQPVPVSQYGTKTKKTNKRTWWWIVGAVALLCICCSIVLYIWNYGDAILYSLGLY